MSGKCPVNLPMIEGALGFSDLFHFCQLFLTLKTGSFSQSYRVDRRVLPCDPPCHPPVRQCGEDNRLTNFQGSMYGIELLLKPPRFLKCILDPRPWSRPLGNGLQFGQTLDRSHLMHQLDVSIIEQTQTLDEQSQTARPRLITNSHETHRQWLRWENLQDKTVKVGEAAPSIQRYTQAVVPSVGRHLPFLLDNIPPTETRGQHTRRYYSSSRVTYLAACDPSDIDTTQVMHSRSLRMIAPREEGAKISRTGAMSLCSISPLSMQCYRLVD